MAQAKLMCDTRTVKHNGTSPIKVAVAHRGQYIYFSTGVDALPFQFADGRIDGDPNAKQFNAILRKRLGEVEDALLNIERTHRVSSLSHKLLRELILREIEPERFQKKPSLISEGFEHQRANVKYSTALSYRLAESYLKRFVGERKYSDLTYDDVDAKMVNKLYDYMRKNVSVNSAAIYIQKVKSVFHYAIDEDLTNNNPFRKLKLKRESTRSRALNIDQLRKFLQVDCNYKEREALLIFELSLLLLGINFTDMYNSQPPIKGRVEYRRAKTGKAYSVNVGKRAKEVLSIIGGKDKLINVRSKTRQAAILRTNRMLAELSERCGKDFPTVTTYWARHTWATLAASLGIPRVVIGAALGHTWAETTGIYVSVNEANIDAAAKIVEEYIYENKRPKNIFEAIADDFVR